MRKALFLFAFIFVWFSASFSLELVPAARESGYLNPDPRERELFFEKKKAFIARLLAEIRKIRPRTWKERKQKRRIIKLIASLPSYWKKINAVLSSKPWEKICSLPEVSPGKTYSLSFLKDFLALGLRIKTERESLKEKIKMDEQDLESLESALDDVYREYLLSWQKEKLTLSDYQVLADLLLLQARWAFFKASLSQRKKLFKALTKRWNEWKKGLSLVFKATVPAHSEIKSLLDEKKKLESQLSAERKKTANEVFILNKQLSLAEIRAGKASEVLRERLRELIRTKQERLSILQIKAEELNFWILLGKCLKGCGEKALEFLSFYSESLKRIESQLAKLKYRRDYLRQRISALETYILLASKRTKLLNERKLLKTVLSEEVRVLERKIQLLEIFGFELENILPLWKERVSTLRRAFSATKKSFVSFEKALLRILYYPIFKIGGRPFTLMNVLKVLLVFVLGLFLIRFLKKRFEEFLTRLGMKRGEVQSLGALFRYFLFLLLILVVLSVSGVNLSQVTIIFGALSVGIGFGLQTIANNFISGIILLTERSIKVGDIVELDNGIAGEVKEITIRSTVIRTFDALEIIVPNSEFISRKISTWTYEDDWRRIRIPFGVAYGTDPLKVKEVAESAAREVEFTQEDEKHPVEVWFVGFGESSLDFELSVWIRQAKIKRSLKEVKSRYYYALHKALTEAKIEIPFPQLDVHVKSLPEGSN